MTEKNHCTERQMILLSPFMLLPSQLFEFIAEQVELLQSLAGIVDGHTGRYHAILSNRQNNSK